MSEGGDNRYLYEWIKENGSWNKGLHYSAERIEQMRQISLNYYKDHEPHNKGKKATLETREKLRQAKLGKDIPLKYKSVCKYDLDGNFIEKYVSIKQAAEINNISKSHICRAIKGGYGCKTAGGYQWKYTTENYMDNIGKAIIDKHILTEEEKEKISNSHKGKNNPMYGKCGGQSPLSKKCSAYIEENYIGTFNSLVEAADSLGVRKEDISACLCGRQKTTKGYTFRYA